MTDTDLTGVWRTRSGSVVRVTGAVPGQLDRWAVTHPDDDEPSIHTGTFIHASWSRVPDAEPAEAEAEQLPDWCEGDPSHLPPAVTAPVLPSDEIPEPGGARGIQKALAAAWDKGYAEAFIWLGRVKDAVGDSAPDPANPWKPAPSQLPWIEHPDAYFRDETDLDVYRAGDMGPGGQDGYNPERRYTRVAVIPWDLIEDLRGWCYGTGITYVDAVIDAADGAS